MAQVACDVDETMLENDDGYEVDGVEVTCGRCNHSTDSFGTSDASGRRCLVLLREECPLNQNNFYVARYGEDQG